MRKIGNGEGYGSGDLPTPSIRGVAVTGSDDFYVQKLNRMPGDSLFEAENGPTSGLFRTEVEDSE